MDALKKFLSNKKADKKFKAAGPGHKLTESPASSPSNRAAQSPRKHGGSPAGTSAGVQERGPAEPSAERRAAAAAALARVEKQRSTSNPNDMLSSRQHKFIKEQARKEIEEERRLKEEMDAKGVSPVKAVDPVEYTMQAVKGLAVDPEAYAVQGVYFTCPMIGPEVLSRSEINDLIRDFLLAQPEEELGVTSCLLIYSCNKGRERVQACVDTLCKYLDNIIQNPDEPKFQKIRCSNKVFQEKVAPILGAAEFLRAANFDLKTIKPDPSSPAEEFWVFSPGDNMESSVSMLTELRDTLKETTPIRPELDRNLQVLMPAQVSKRRELPPDFYELTGEELKREQKMRSEKVEKELTLRTKAQRDRDEMREQRLYRYAVMRIRFPDGLTLQGTFSSGEKVGDLYEFVQENLGFEDGEFSLRKSGGEVLSVLDMTLAEAHLPPASVLIFKLESGAPASATGEVTYLKSELLALVQEVE